MSVCRKLRSVFLLAGLVPLSASANYPSLYPTIFGASYCPPRLAEAHRQWTSASETQERRIRWLAQLVQGRTFDGLDANGDRTSGMAIGVYQGVPGGRVEISVRTDSGRHAILFFGEKEIVGDSVE